MELREIPTVTPREISGGSSYSNSRWNLVKTSEVSRKFLVNFSLDFLEQFPVGISREIPSGPPARTSDELPIELLREFSVVILKKFLKNLRGIPDEELLRVLQEELLMERL